MATYIGGLDFSKMIEAILNKLIEKKVLTLAEAQKIIDSAKQKTGK